MRILFLCGSLEPGRDGVGDYSRRLAGELIRQGHHTFVGAINDRQVAEVYEGSQEIDKTTVPVLRLPSFLSSKRRFSKMKNWIDTIDPDWISLQFVPFSFQIKGMPFFLAKDLQSIISGRKLHIMFHELWVGMERNSSYKIFLWGLIQKKIILSTTKRLVPRVVHTHTKLYQLTLTNIGISAQFLPIFSNIPVEDRDQKDIIKRKTGEKKIIFVLFGGIHPGTPARNFSEEAGKYARSKNVQLVLRIAGHSGKEKNIWISYWKSEGLIIEDIGEQSQESLSKCFSSSNYGISTTPLALIEKSGSVAAMQAHNLPIISVSSSWKPKLKLKAMAPKGVFEYRVGNFNYCIKGKAFPTKNSVPQVTFQLLNSFLNI